MLFLQNARVFAEFSRPPAYLLAEDEELRESVTDADEVDVDGKKFQRLEQASSATYFGRFGGHHIEEAASRAVVGPARVARRPRNPRTRSV